MAMSIRTNALFPTRSNHKHSWPATMHKPPHLHTHNATTNNDPPPPKIGCPVILLWALPDHKLSRCGLLWRWQRSHVCLSVSATRIRLLPFRRLLSSVENNEQSHLHLLSSALMYTSVGPLAISCCWPFLIARQRSHVAVTQSRQPAQETAGATGWVEMRWMPPERFVSDNVFISNGTTSWSWWESSREVLHANLRKYTFNLIFTPAIPGACNFYYENFYFPRHCSWQLLLYE